jgi:hypothetical protein
VALWRELGVAINIAEPMLMEAYRRELKRRWRGEGDRHAPTSFYISSFPGDDPHVCGRAAIYNLMNIPEEKPLEPKVQGYFDAGKDTETNFVCRWAAEGMLLSGDETAGERQTKFSDPDVWSSGAVDAIILPYGWRKPFIVEVKTTSLDKLTSMLDNPDDTPASHAKYVRQLKTYIGYAHELPYAPRVTVCKDSWSITQDVTPGLHWCKVHRSFDCAVEEIQLSPPDDGELIYAARDEPTDKIVSYYQSYDQAFMRAGRERLAQWRRAFEDGVLPPHPREGQSKKWSVSPCTWCGVKKSTCKPDYENKVVTLDASHGLDHAEKVRGEYDYEATRAGVFARWNLSDPLKTKVAA